MNSTQNLAEDPWSRLSPGARQEVLVLLDRLALPALFALLTFAWPLALRTPPPWWVFVGLLWYGGLFAWASALHFRTSTTTA